MEDRINNAAIRLTLALTNTADLPKRFSGNKDELFKEDKKNSVAERNFQMEIAAWRSFIVSVLKYNNTDLSWRLFCISPRIENNIYTISLCNDFIKITDLFIKIRDDKKASPELIGRFSKLHTEFQKEIEKILSFRR